jgi:outer membrane lipoprotein-sorting protein
MKSPTHPWLVLAIFLGLACPLAAQDANGKSPAEVFAAAIQNLAAIIEPAKDAEARTLSARVEITQPGPLAKDFAGQSFEFAFQAPSRMRVSGRIDKRPVSLGRDGQTLWAYVPEKKFGVAGEPGRPWFLSAPEKIDTTTLPPFKLPLPREQLILLPLLMNLEALAAEKVDQTDCLVIQATPKPEAIQALKIPRSTLKLWLRANDLLPARIAFQDGAKAPVELTFHDLTLAPAWPDEQWRIPARAGDHVEKTALSHLVKCLSVAVDMATQTIPALGPATGERRVLATEGKGRLEWIDGTRVLFVSGTPREMGHQQGVLLRKEIRHVVNRILYGVGVASSFEKGAWFFGEIEAAQKRINPYIDPRYLAEMDAIAEAAGLQKEEIRLANFFPELFHCSGFALSGKATVDGKLYHGRILDYLRGVGLEQNAVVMIIQPDVGNAWANVSYAGFVGTVTAMNVRQVAIGEMGGRGEGKWDGKPMAQLLREVMERANTLEEALAILRQGPRTCEYYYVVSDAKTHTAAGVAATPERFETIRPGETHERLPEAIADAVVLSAGDRYKKLVERVREQYGKIDAAGARALMRRPVAMNSNIHSALFAPDTLDFWVANADSENVASHTRYTHYNLGDLLKQPADKTPETGAK